MRLSDQELDAILAEGGLELAQPYSESCEYNEDDYLFTRCVACGAEAHYRLKYILKKNEDGEKVCRACHWRCWYVECRDRDYPGIDLDWLTGAGAARPLTAMTFPNACKLAAANGYELVELLSGERTGEDLLVVRCKACGVQSVERPCDVACGCGCHGESRGVSVGEEHVEVPREATPVASDRYQDGTARFLVDSDAPCVGWWDEKANRGGILSDLTCRTRQVYAWKCSECGYEFHAPVYLAHSMRRCPYCTALKAIEFDIKWDALREMTALDFPELLLAWDDAKDPSTVSITSGNLIHLECPQGHHPSQTLYSYLKNGCMVCRGLATKARPDQSYLDTTDPELAAEWVRPRDGGNYSPSNVKDGSKRTVVWHCIACGYEWEATVKERQYKNYNCCPSCGKVMGSLAWKYPQLAAEWSPRNPISPWNIKPFSALGFKPEWVCSQNPNHVWQMTTNLRINKGRGCPFCEKESKK